MGQRCVSGALPQGSAMGDPACPGPAHSRFTQQSLSQDSEGCRSGLAALAGTSQGPEGINCSP